LDMLEGGRETILRDRPSLARPQQQGLIAFFTRHPASATAVCLIIRLPAQSGASPQIQQITRTRTRRRWPQAQHRAAALCPRAVSVARDEDDPHGRNRSALRRPAHDTNRTFAPLASDAACGRQIALSVARPSHGAQRGTRAKSQQRPAFHFVPLFLCGCRCTAGSDSFLHAVRYTELSPERFKELSIGLTSASPPRADEAISCEVWVVSARDPCTTANQYTDCAALSK
jgi:hypothetical protein